MLFHFRKKFPQLNTLLDKYEAYLQKKDVPTKTILLSEGKRSQHYIFIERGCVRAFFDKDGQDQTVQFLFENDGLTSFNSFINNVPSQFTIETIEPSTVYLLPKKYATELLNEMSRDPDMGPVMLQLFAQRQTHYINELVSFIRDTPEQRYKHLLTEKPHIIQRVPQHYIASYLGVSKVHLSRIKSKLAKGKPHF